MSQIDFPGAVQWYLHVAGDPGVESPLHFFVAWMVYFVAYGFPLLALISVIVVLT